MSDEEEQFEEEQEEETEAEAVETPKRSRSGSRLGREPDEGGKAKTEAELAMLAQKRKQDEEDEAKLAHYEEQRRIQREKEEEELRILKEKQERRKAEREEEERILAERRREEEERRRQEDEERRAKVEADKKKKEDEKRRRQELLMAGFQVGGFEIVPAKKDKNQEKFDKFGNIVKAKAEMGFTKEQHEEQKRRALADIVKPIDFSEMDAPSLKLKIKELHTRLCRLEGDKYDLEDRRTRQEYDLKELNERQRQIARAKALKKGMNPDDVPSGPHPPKVPVVSKYDRQIDRRTFAERRAIYDAPRSVPHFPNVPPMQQELVMEIKAEERAKNLEVNGVVDTGGEDEAVEEDEEVEEEEEEE